MELMTTDRGSRHEYRDHAEPPAFTTDAKGRIVHWNQAAEDYLGVPAHQALGRPVSAVVDREQKMQVIRIPSADGFTKVHVLEAAETVDSRCPLSFRERQVVELLSQGYAAINIAARLDLAHATVRNHIQNALRKLNVHGQVEAVSVAFRNGWLPAPHRLDEGRLAEMDALPVAC